MASTTNLGLTKPNIGNTDWGTDVNDNWDKIDKCVPVGVVHMYIGSTAPDGWLFLNADTIGNASSGATHASDDYETLFDLVKALYPNSGSESFSSGDTVILPDMRGRCPLGVGQGSGLTNRTLGNMLGTETHALSTGEMGNHQHGKYSGSGGYGYGTTNPIYSSLTSEKSVTTAATAHQNMQPSLCVNFIIKT